MSKLETVKSLVGRESASISEQVEELKRLQRRTLPEVAEKFEPLARSMAALIEGTNTILKEVQERSTEGLRTNQAILMQEKKTWQEIAENLEKASAKADNAAQEWTFRMWLAILLAMIILTAPSAYVILQGHYSKVAKLEERAAWLDQAVAGLDDYLTKELYPNLNQNRQKEIRRLYKKIQLRLTVPPERSEGS